MIELEKPRLWRSLEELRDRARDVEEKVASLAGRAREEMDEVCASYIITVAFERVLCMQVSTCYRGRRLRPFSCRN